ncbi:MAG: phosphatidylglycerophosphatase A [Firmicutes bacterium]|nr:phosphatidylglycerophosphatase A [Bacillota bacterium]
MRWLSARGVEVQDLADIVYKLQKKYNPKLTFKECLESVDAVLDKREVQHAVLTGITLDILAEEGSLPEPLQSIIAEDNPLYGIDEILALSITNVYGSIGLTSFGYLDKCKEGLLGRLDRGENGLINTFLDDIVAGLAAAASARIAHRVED